MFNQVTDNDGMINDLFTQKMLETVPVDGEWKPVEVDERVMQHIRFEEVFIVDYSKLCPSLPKRFYKNMVPGVSITMCECCCKFFG